MRLNFSRSRRARFASTTMVSVLLLAGAARSSAQPVTDVQLPAAARGANAVSALGAHLPAVAKAYGLDPQRLVTLLQTQPSMEVDVRGALLFSCERVTAAPEDGLTATSSVTLVANGGAVDAFQLHSMPGATRVIYLDFDGHVTRGTAWNSAYTGGADIVSAPFDLDGDPSTFSTTERAFIESVWKRVAEDFAPFAIDVTTQDPGVESLRKSSSSDTAYGMRVVISPTNWYKATAGGTAYVGSFSWNSDTPCWVFTAQLANHDKYVSEGVSHEVGHTLGLNHDGVGGASPSEYYFGQGNWAPIMGVGDYVAVTQFSKGEYANASNTEDDFAIIATHAPLASDDHGGTFGSATVLAGPSVAGGGTIETRTDVDVFRFDTDAGQVTLNIVSPSNEPDLHMRVELLNASGQVLLASDPNAMSASFATSLAAGTYYLRVSGIGFGDPKLTGYSNYGSVGNYVITGNLVPISGKQSPIAQVTASTTSGVAALKVDFNGAASFDPDGTIVSYRWDFGNGDTSTAASPSYTYATAGGYTAVLSVTDNVGLSSSASVFISVTAPANKAPTAVASVSAVSGVAPLQVTFSSAGSADADGSIVSYSWNFGDGTTSTSASPSKTYSVAGNYVATLTVTDNLGATGTASIAISVARDPNKDFDVAQYSLAKVTARSGVSASATVVVLDRLGRPVPGVGISIQWSGVVAGTSSGKTDANGKATINSNRAKKAGSITGTIVSVSSATGTTYVASLFAAPLSLSISTQ